MKRSRDFETLKVSIKVLLSSFLAAFIGAAWVAYIAIQLGAEGSVWLPVSAVGAAVVCVIMQALPRPRIDLHLFN